jgi:hypothetical protein
MVKYNNNLETKRVQYYKFLFLNDTPVESRTV